MRFTSGDTTYQIRDLTTEDADQYNRLLRYTFQVTEQELQESGWRNDEIVQSKFPILKRADVIGAFDEDELVSQFAVYPLKMNIYDAVYSVGFITSVCTYPEYTGKGLMKKLMHLSLERMREKGQSFALLYPYSIPLYRKRGFEIISNKISYVVKDRQVPANAKAPGYVRRVSWENEEFKNLHNQFAQITHGCLFRNSLAWEEYWRWDEDDTIVAIYYSKNDTPKGYMVYMIKDDIMYIKEMIYIDYEAHQGLWEYIHAHDSMIDEVHGNTYDSESIAFEMADSDITETLKPYVMGRIIDIKQFFEQYVCDDSVKETHITFHVKDDFLKWNNGKFTVCFKDGSCSFIEDENAYDVTLDIATLTTLLLGYKNAEQLCLMERMKCSQKAMEALNDVLFHEVPCISDYI